MPALGATHETAGVVATPKPVVTVQVRALVEFALRRGDLREGGDFVGPRRALAGTRGHQRLQQARPAGYEREVRVSQDLEAESFVLRVQGRIDGLLTTPQRTLLEEIKTVQGRWTGLADPLHWAQAKCYAALYARPRGLSPLTVQLTYLHLQTGQVTAFQEVCSLAELTAFFDQATAFYLGWVREHRQWCQQRDHSIRALSFPFPHYRPGQRKLAVAVYRAASRGGRLFVEASTGTGKTISVLFPAVKALGDGKLDHLFYLTARTVVRAVAEKAFDDLRAAGLRLRTLTLTAREKLCLQQGTPCDPHACPLARGYYDRRHAAMRAALRHEAITRPVLEAVSGEHAVCPFALSLDLAPWVDALIGDYNHVFDPHASLRHLLPEEGGGDAFLVDEAHNLVDRARDMFSAELAVGEIQEVRRAIKQALPACARALGRVATLLRQQIGAAPGPLTAPPSAAPPLELDLFAPPDRTDRPTAPLAGPAQAGASASPSLLADLSPPLDHALAAIEAWLARNEPTAFRAGLLELYWRLLAFRTTMDLYDERYVTIREPAPAARLRLFCLDPSYLLAQTLARGKLTVFFSATLAPIEFYRALLGGRPEDPLIQLPSPFAPEHLLVLVQDRICTQLKARAATLAAVVQAIATLVAGRPGNYLVYLPSYEYLAAVRQSFQADHPRVAVLAQSPRMSEAERAAFLATFQAEANTTRVGFAVLGGVFGEGIDLVGERLIGVAVVGVGLPQLCTERDLIRDYFQPKTGAGFDYAYSFPGLNRVLQAIGRVIRSETDRGAVLLIDTRFADARYWRRFPPWWRWQRVRSPAGIQAALGQFWTKPAGVAASPRSGA